MKTQLFIFECSKCRHFFKAPKICADAYGEFLLRSIGNAEEAYLDALADKTYDEVHDLLKSHPRLMTKTPNKLADVLRKTYGAIACDPDTSDTPFQIGAFPKCPNCGSQEMEYWEATEPPEFIEKNLSPVSHARWQTLNHLEKISKIDQILSLYGY